MCVHRQTFVLLTAANRADHWDCIVSTSGFCCICSVHLLNLLRPSAGIERNGHCLPHVPCSSLCGTNWFSTLARPNKVNQPTIWIVSYILLTHLSINHPLLLSFVLCLMSQGESTQARFVLVAWPAVHREGGEIDPLTATLNCRPRILNIVSNPLAFDELNTRLGKTASGLFPPDAPGPPSSPSLLRLGNVGLKLCMVWDAGSTKSCPPQTY